MPMPDYRLLPPRLTPLADKFYRSHRSSMRTRPEHRVWVAQHAEIVAALCLQNMAHGQWLTSLLVAPAHRCQGLASSLVERALSDAEGPTWLFCHPDLQPFYQRLDFRLAEQLPAPLAERLTRYQRNKPLDAMLR